MSNNCAIETHQLTKRYGNCLALDKLNMKLLPNKIYGLLGRNGAGKTTVLNILTSRIFPSEGYANVLGKNSYENVDVLKQICFIEEKGFYAEAIKVSQVLKLASGLYENWDEDYAEELLALFEMDKNKKYKQLSRGMETSLGLIIGLASRAPVTIFDEPSLGLDAVVRERFYDAVIEDFAEYPRTIIISTHLIDEVSKLFEDVIIVDSGKVVLQSNAVELKEKAFYLSGKEEDVRALADNFIIMKEEYFASTLILSVYAKNEIVLSEKVNIEPMPLQKLFVNLINPEIHENLKKGGVLQ